MTLLPKQEKLKKLKHRRWIASLPCLITGRPDVQCAHIRKGAQAGAGRKPPDFRCVPLCISQHLLEGEGEESFWIPYGGYERAVRLAKDLYDVSGDTESALIIINEWRREWKR